MPLPMLGCHTAPWRLGDPTPNTSICPWPSCASQSSRLRVPRDMRIAPAATAVNQDYQVHKLPSKPPWDMQLLCFWLLWQPAFLPSRGCPAQSILPALARQRHRVVAHPHQAGTSCPRAPAAGAQGSASQFRTAQTSFPQLRVSSAKCRKAPESARIT